MSERDDLDETQMSGDTPSLFLPAVFRPAEIADASELPPNPPSRAQRGYPLKRPIGGYTHYEYEREKRQGVRRTNGAKKLKRLSNRHLEIISRHLAGESGEFISSAMNITYVTVSRVLNDPLARQFISRVFEDRQKEIDALAGDAIDAVRKGLQSESSRVQLSAVDKFTKLKDSIGKKDDEGLTAEDVLEKMFSRIDAETVNMQLNFGGK